MRIPITMCHGVHPPGEGKVLTQEHLDRLVGIAAEMGFQSINYDDLAAACRARMRPMADRLMPPAT